MSILAHEIEQFVLVSDQLIIQNRHTVMDDRGRLRGYELCTGPDTCVHCAEGRNAQQRAHFIALAKRDGEDLWLLQHMQISLPQYRTLYNSFRQGYNSFSVQKNEDRWRRVKFVPMATQPARMSTAQAQAFDGIAEDMRRAVLNLPPLKEDPEPAPPEPRSTRMGLLFE